MRKTRKKSVLWVCNCPRHLYFKMREDQLFLKSSLVNWARTVTWFLGWAILTVISAEQLIPCGIQCFLSDAGNSGCLIAVIYWRAQLQCYSVGQRMRNLLKWADWHLQTILVSYVVPTMVTHTTVTVLPVLCGWWLCMIVMGWICLITVLAASCGFTQRQVSVSHLAFRCVWGSQKWLF